MTASAFKTIVDNEEIDEKETEEKPFIKKTWSIPISVKSYKDKGNH